ncbi:MAG: hypothetical protein MJ240_13715, partial [Kiritimatiellae bacterium]|nr:hypothetical protein [Kiritimatiellia bacterium]
MATHEVTIYENKSNSKEKAPYLGTYLNKDTVNLESICAGVSRLCGIPEIELQAILTGAFDEFAALEREGAVRINFDGGCICQAITGSFASSDAAFDASRNKLELVYRLDDDIRNCLVNVAPSIVTDVTSTKVRLDNVADTAMPRPYQVLHGQNPFKATGINLVMADEGAEVYLENALGVKFPCVVDDVISRQEFTAHTAELLEPGDYKVVVKSRGGDAEGQL